MSEPTVCTVAVIDQAAPEIIEVGSQHVEIIEVVAAGPQGMPGEAAVGIAGHPVNVSALSVGDMLMFSGAAWTNENVKSISDGGNF